MADVGVTFTLTTPGPTLTFNDGSLDQFYITELRGLGGPPIRAPIDNVPLGDGGLVHTFYKGPRHIIVEGIFLITSVRVMNDIVEQRNSMESDLMDALEAIIAADGTFAWTPQGEAARSLTVRHDVMLDFSHADNYTNLTWNFGLVAANPDW